MCLTTEYVVAVVVRLSLPFYDETLVSQWECPIPGWQYPPQRVNVWSIETL